MESLNILCLLWKGEFYKIKYKSIRYTIDWVVKLKNMISRNIDIPFRFICLTNIKDLLVSSEYENIEFINLQYNWPGWWSKMEYFRPDLPQGRILCLDLDVLIIDNLSGIINFPSEFTIGNMFGLPVYNNNNNKTKVKGIVQKYNSSVMVFDRGNISNTIWNIFNLNPDRNMNYYRGDQDFLADFFPDLDIFPQKWIVKLKSCKTAIGEIIPSKNTKIILCMPEKNKIAAEKYEFVKHIWK